MPIDLDPILAAAGLGGERAAFAAAWPRHGAVAPESRFLSPMLVGRTAELLGLPEAHRTALLDGLALFREHPELARLAAHVRSVFLARQEPAEGGGWRWPMLPADLHPAAPLFYAWPVLACVPDTIEHNRGRGIPEATTLAVLRDLERWMDEYRRAKGRWGFDRAGWLWLSVQGRLHQLGRLQFELSRWGAPVRAFRHRGDRRLAMLMAGSQEMRADGRHQGVARSPRDAGGFATRYEESVEGWRGHPVTARGCTGRETALLPAAEWEPALVPGDPVLFLHIPAGGGLDIAACAASCREAQAFFPRHFPGMPFKAIISISWMFDPQLADRLPASANLVRFQRAFHLHPHADLQGTQIRERVLGDPEADPRTVTATSSLQKAVVAHLLAGGLWCQHGAVLLPDEVMTAFT